VTADKKANEVLYNYPSLFAALNGKDTYKTVVIIDACYSGDAIKHIPTPSQKFIVITSSAQNEVTNDLKVGSDKISFAKFFNSGISRDLKGYKGPLKEKKTIVPYPADLNPKDGIITSLEAFEYAFKEIKNFQTPQIQQSEAIPIFGYDISNPYN
jgi:hypothetical protein